MSLETNDTNSASWFNIPQRLDGLDHTVLDIGAAVKQNALYIHQQQTVLYEIVETLIELVSRFGEGTDGHHHPSSRVVSPGFIPAVRYEQQQTRLEKKKIAAPVMTQPRRHQYDTRISSNTKQTKKPRRPEWNDRTVVESKSKQRQVVNGYNSKSGIGRLMKELNMRRVNTCK